MALVLCFSPTAQASDVISLNTHGPRTSGPVSASLQNEINAAVDRGRAWLVSRQNSDGGWGSNDHVRLTAMAALALAQEAAPDEKASAARAAQWLLSSAVSNATLTCDPEAQSWRALALHVMCKSTPGATPRLPPLPASSNPASIAPIARLLLDCSRNMPAGDSRSPPPDAIHALAQLAACWNGDQFPLRDGCSVTRQYWTWAHFINGVGGGTLADNQGRVIDWRNDLARALVSSQTSIGFWPADPPGNPIAETALALLALKEL